MSGSASLLKTVLKLTVLVILPVLIVSAMVWYIVLSDIGQAREELKKVVPNFTMTGGSSVVFAADGKKLYDLKSDYAEYFSVTDSTSFVNPSADFYNEKTGIKSFFLRGDAGVYNTGDMLTLTDNVLGLRYDEQGKLSGRLRSDYLEYDFDDRHVRSNVRVVYTDIYQNSDDCTGLDGDIGSGIYNFFRDCHAIINTRISPSTSPPRHRRRI